MKNMYGDNHGTLNDMSKANIGSVNQYYGIAPHNPKVPVQKNEEELSHLTKKKIIEGVISIFFMILSGIIKIFLDKEIISTPWTNILLLILMIAFALFGLMFTLSALVDIVKTRSLKKSGKLVEMQSKQELISELLNSKETEQQKYRKCGTLYKNCEGKVYRLVGGTCPMCETEPKGQMNFYYDKEQNVHILACSRQVTLHKTIFDHTAAF